MAQPSEACFAFCRALMTLAGALHFLDQRLTCVVNEGQTDLRLCRDRLLADDMAAVEDVPPHDNAAVGGGDAIRIFTGAPMPAGCDSVVV